jgi:hypothetical protein
VLRGTDAEDGSTLEVTVHSGPAHGRLDVTTGQSPLSARYTPDANFHGADQFTFLVRDSLGASSAPVTVDLVVTPVNDLPQADAVDPVTTTEDQASTPFTLGGRDTEDARADLTVEVTAGPGHGALNVQGASASYAPDANYAGPDSFAYRVLDRDGGASPPVTVALTVLAVNDAPLASGLGLIATAEDTPSPVIVLTGTDVEDPESALIVSVTAGPQQGTLSVSTGAAPLSLIYTPNADYQGPDSFTFEVQDPGDETSEPVTVALNVVAVEDLPVAEPVEPVTLAEDGSTELVLTGADTEDAVGDLTVRVRVAPSSGSLDAASGNAPLSLTYTPDPNAFGPDSFEFEIVDTAGGVSQPVTVQLNVLPVNDEPVAVAIEPVATNEDEDAGLIVLTGADVEDEEDALTVTVTAAPSHGALDVTEGAAPLSVTYTPDENHFGPDSFTYKVTDTEGGSSESVTVQLSIASANDLPLTSQPELPAFTEDTQATAFALTGSDVEDAENQLTVNVTAGPSHGSFDVVSGAAPLLVVYTPDPNFAGVDEFTFELADTGGGTSASRTVTFTVAAINDAPKAAGIAPVSTSEDTSAGPMTLTGSDVEDAENQLTVNVTGAPAHGSLDVTQGTAPLSVTYTPDARPEPLRVGQLHLRADRHRRRNLRFSHGRAVDRVGERPAADEPARAARVYRGRTGERLRPDR